MKEYRPRRLIIGVRTQNEVSKEFIRAWKNAASGKPTKGPNFRLYFDSLDHLWRKLTPRRTELLQSLRQQGPLSMRKLALHLGRDYKNVRMDIHELSEVDLVKKTRDGLYMVPWDSIDLQLPLSAAS